MPRASLEARLERLEEVAETCGSRLVLFRHGEAPDDAVERALQEGRNGPFVVLPETVSSMEEWERLYAAYVQEVAQRGGPSKL